MKRIRQIAETVGWAGLISLTSLLSGWLAIMLLLGGNLKVAIIFTCTAFLLDAADGIVARRLGKASDFGRQFDSMIDAFNYSLFAALVTHQILLPNLLGVIAGYTILAFGILRLVLFNQDGYLDKGDVLYYRGVVTPHLNLATLFIYIAKKFIAISDPIVAGILIVLAIGQISQIRVRKTGALAFWLPATVAIAVGSYLWL